MTTTLLPSRVLDELRGTHPRPTRRTPVQRERAIQAQIVRLLRSVGGQVWTTGTTRRKGDHPGTCMTPGLPDIFAFLPVRSTTPVGMPKVSGLWVLLSIEVKSPKGRLTPEQRLWRQCCQDAGAVDYVTGGLDAVVDWLAAYGYVRRP